MMGTILSCTDSLAILDLKKVKFNKFFVFKKNLYVL